MNARWNALALSYSNEIVILLYAKHPKPLILAHYTDFYIACQD